jgi:4-amino-4-deoxy-L-arabinose transferase-like glycosyltransferase
MSDSLLPVPSPTERGEPTPEAPRVPERSPGVVRPPEGTTWDPRVARNVLLAGLALRVAYFTLWRTFLIPPGTFGFGWEMGRVASALASGRGFADPFQEMSGSTAWVPPLFPFLVAGVFKVFGVYTTASGWVVLFLNSLFSSLTGVALYSLGTDLAGEKLGRRTAWVWALFPYTIYWPARVVWDTILTAYLLTAVVWLTVRIGREGTRRQWPAFGLLWGVAALSNPATLSFFLPSWAWALWAERRRGFPRPGRVVLALVLFALPVGAWMARNERVFGKLLFIRDNFGEELRLGNGPGGHGEWMVWLHPTHSPEELQRYLKMGEPAYVEWRGREAVASIRGNIPLFLGNCLRRINWFWFGTTKGEASDPFHLFRNFAFSVASLLAWVGLGLLRRDRRPEWVLFFWLFALFPLVYYVTFVVMRYRHPIEPEMILLIVYALSAAARPQDRAVSAVGYDVPVGPSLGPLPPGVMRTGNEG